MMPIFRIAALAAGSVLASCATVPDSRAALAPGARYVAMGSSFAAGAGIEPVKRDAPERCGRSEINYATLLATQLNLDLVDATCGGATTAHILGPWDELPAQIDAVTPDTRLVTVTIGGNDVGYVANLFAASCRAGVRNERLVDPATANCPSFELPSDEDFVRLRANLAMLLTEISRHAPQARIVVVQYLTLVPGQGCAAAPLTDADARDLRELGKRLARITAEAAAAAGVDLFSADALSTRHTACDPVPWSRALANDYQPAMGAPWHPNAAGHAAIAQGLTALLRR